MRLVTGDFRSIFMLVLVSAALALFVVVNRMAQTIRLDLDNVQSVTIRDYWFGLSFLTPIESAYSLTEVNGAWVGTVRFSISVRLNMHEEAISIPAHVVREFRQILETAAPFAGEYTPARFYTDSYPSLTLGFQNEAGTFEVFSRSQGEDYVPWAATVNGRSYVIDSAIPMRALETLMPYLKRDVLRKLLEQMRAEAAG